MPEPLIQGPAARVMSLRDGTKKMSKSDPSEYSRINLSDDADAIAQKVRKAKTDAEPLPSAVEGLAGRAEAENLVGIYAALSETSREKILAEFGGAQFSAFKNALVDLAVAKLGPIGSEMRRLESDPGYIDAGFARRRKAGAPNSRTDHGSGEEILSASSADVQPQSRLPLPRLRRPILSRYPISGLEPDDFGGDMFIQTEATPNPATLKFLPGGPVLENGSREIQNEEEARISPLASALFTIDGVSGVFLGPDFISVTKSTGEWPNLKPAILGAIMEHFMSGGPILTPGADGGQQDAEE